MSLVRRVSCFFVLAAAVGLRAQSTVPTASHPLPAQALALGGAAATVDLTAYFTVSGVTGQVAQFDTVLGKFNVELLASAAPQSVTNFLSYVGDGSYTNTLIHRSAALGATATSNRIVQGGGYYSSYNSVTHKAPIPLEYNLPNTRGTLAMARTSDVNSATSEWFFNVDDNTTVLGASNGGGYAVFARVLGTGMTVVDAIAALQTYNIGGAFTNIPLRNIQNGQTSVQPANLILVNSVTAVPVFPPAGGGKSVLTFSVINSAPNVVAAAVSGSTLTLTAVATGTASVTVHAADTNGNFVNNVFNVTIAVPPTITTQPASQAVAAGAAVTLTAAASGSPAATFQWQLNGGNVSGATNATLTLSGVQPANTGLYTAVVTSVVPAVSNPAIVGVTTASKVIGAGSEIAHGVFVVSNGNTFDQVLPSGAALAVTAEGTKITRTSFVDLTDDIVQVEFGGAGTLSLVLDAATGPALPVNYNQAINYMKGHVGLVVVGADETTNVSVFSVGRITAVNQALFKSDVTYDGMADLAFIAISSTNGKFGGLRASNANFYAAKGITGVYAPGVQFTGPVFLSNLTAYGSATPMIVIGSSPDTRITGGDLTQANGQPVQVSGLTQLKFTAGTDSHGNGLSAKNNQAVLMQNGADVTSQVVVNPSP